MYAILKSILLIQRATALLLEETKICPGETKVCLGETHDHLQVVSIFKSTTGEEVSTTALVRDFWDQLFKSVLVNTGIK